MGTSPSFLLRVPMSLLRHCAFSIALLPRVLLCSSKSSLSCRELQLLAPHIVHFLKSRLHGLEEREKSPPHISLTLTHGRHYADETLTVAELNDKLPLQHAPGSQKVMYTWGLAYPSFRISLPRTLVRLSETLCLRPETQEVVSVYLHSSSDDSGKPSSSFGSS